jgi:hypothetical protein
MPDKTNPPDAEPRPVRLYADIHATVKAISIRERRSIQTVVDMLLREALEKLPKTKR